MSEPRIVLTAGFDRARNVLAVAELLHRRRVAVEGLLVVSPYSWQRLRRFVRREGVDALRDAVPRLLGWDETKEDDEKVDPLTRFYREHELERRPLSDWARDRQVDYRSVGSINDETAVQFVESVSPDWLVYGGGGILRKGIIEAADGRVLNAHHGPLPEVRGMNAAEWSLLLGYDPTVTVHLINQGIDTGGIISEHPVPVYRNDTIEHLRKRCTTVGIEALCQTVLDPPERLPEPQEGAAEHRQCFVLAPALRELLEKRLEQGVYAQPKTPECE